MTSHINKRDLPWVALICVSFAIALVVSWQRWGNPLVDCGREMNQPLRLLQGEMLYSDVRHIYGPLSPYLNASLYKIFGPSLGVLYGDGIATAALILALTYWIARRLMGPAAAAASTLSVMWLCAFKQAGNYILPYSYSALHGCALGLLSVAMLVKAISNSRETASTREGEQKRSSRGAGYLILAGVFAGLATLAKTEMGFAAMATGLTTSVLAGYPVLRRLTVCAAMFVLPAVSIVAGVYSLIAHQAGWATLFKDSFLFLNNLPPALVYFNKRVSGFDEPVQSLIQMFGAAVRLGCVAAMVAAAGMLLGGRKRESRGEMPVAGMSRADAGLIRVAQLWLILALSLFVFFSIPALGAIGWDRGPYLAMPLILLALLLIGARNARSDVTQSREIGSDTLILLAVTVYALASLARVVLRVRSGGAYSSYLLPASIILFTYAWSCVFAGRFRDPSVRRIVSGIWIGLILADVLGTAPLLAYRFRERNTYTLSTPRGTIIAVPDLGQAVDEAIRFISAETNPGESVAVLPEGTSLLFFTGRRNPLREEITTPGYLDDAGEQRAIQRLADSNTPLILVTNRPTPEFGAAVIGQDYCKRLMGWVEQNFQRVATFGPEKGSNLEIGDKTFFIRAYRKRP